MTIAVSDFTDNFKKFFSIERAFWSPFAFNDWRHHFEWRNSGSIHFGIFYLEIALCNPIVRIFLKGNSKWRRRQVWVGSEIEFFSTTGPWLSLSPTKVFLFIAFHGPLPLIKGIHKLLAPYILHYQFEYLSFWTWKCYNHFIEASSPC